MGPVLRRRRRRSTGCSSRFFGEGYPVGLRLTGAGLSRRSPSRQECSTPVIFVITAEITEDAGNQIQNCSWLRAPRGLETLAQSRNRGAAMVPTAMSVRAAVVRPKFLRSALCLVKAAISSGVGGRP